MSLAYLCGSTFGFPAVPLTYVCTPPTPQSSLLQLYSQLWNWVDCTHLLFFSKIVSAVSVPLHLHLNFWIILCVSTKSLADYLIWIALNLFVSLGRSDFFTKPSLSVYEQRRSLHLFWSSLISFISILQFSAYKSWTLHLNISFLCVVVNGMVF